MSVQETWWAGSFGSEYTTRNRVDWRARRNFWELILETARPKSVLEVGCNAGWNLEAIRSLDSGVNLRGVDVNDDALAEARGKGFDVSNLSARLVGTTWAKEFDLVATCGVLIHVPPLDIFPVMTAITRASKKWVLAVEYAAAYDEPISYRGHEDRLWRRPFGEMYGELGMDIVAEFDVAKGDGFDDCRAWLLSKPEK